MNQIRVLIADDHKTVRAGLRLIIDAEPDITVIGEAGDGQEAVELSLELVPDVLVMDISMPNVSGLTAAATIKRTAPQVKILTLTRHSDKAYLQELLQAGVSGYVLKQSESGELLRAIRSIAEGGEYLDPAVTGNVFDLLSSTASKLRGDSDGKELTERDEKVLRLIARGYSNKEIADQLNTSVKTIETQKASAIRKLGIKSRNEIVDYAVLRGWLKED